MNGAVLVLNQNYEPLNVCNVRRAILLVFDGNSMLDGQRPVDLGPGRPWKVTVKFRTNLLRGTYAISGLLIEEHRRWPTVHLGVLGSFVVAETTRGGGVADLEPSFHTSTPVEV